MSIDICSGLELAISDGDDDDADAAVGLLFLKTFLYIVIKELNPVIDPIIVIPISDILMMYFAVMESLLETLINFDVVS